MQHIELHNHTHYSVLDGAATPEDYMKRAAEIGMTHIAITDHGTTSGHRDFQREAKKAGIKPILGIEAYITHDRLDRRSAASRQDGTNVYNHITLLAKNGVGLRNIEQMNRIAWQEGFYHKPRMDFELLEEYHEGVIALSGCMSGLIAKKYLNGFPARATQDAKYLKEVFGDDFYMEVMESNSDELNNWLINLGKELNIKPVVTSDCHMARKEDLPLAEVMLILNTGPKSRKEMDLSYMAKASALDALNHLYPDRAMSFHEFELWLHTYDEHVANLKKQGIGPEAVSNTMEIADKIGDYPYYEKMDTLPAFDTGGRDSFEVLSEETYNGLKSRGIDTEVNRERVAMELDTIKQLKLADYFLIEKDFVDYARGKDILTGYGRGSAVSYLTNYALGITKIDPMPYNLLPERFLSAEREDSADIDTDFAVEGRYEVKEYAQRKYDHVSNIATFGYYKDKSAIKAAAKAFKANYQETNKLLMKFETIADFEASSETRDYRSRYPHLIPIAKNMVDKIQNTGMHAGGIIISKESIDQHAPLQTANDPSDDSKAKGRVPVAASDMRELADMGYVKYDLLGLRTLSIVDDTMKLIKQRHGVTIDIEDIPLDDKNLYDMISQGYTAGLFQTEASASTKTILEMGGVANFSELVASNALVRPGAANSTVGSTYITGKKTGEYSYAHPDMKWFTEDTFSAILYQEQQLLLCEHIAGMSKLNSNKVRKAISKKIPEDLAIWQDEFITGATDKVGKKRAVEIWHDLEASADYAFAKAHAVGYSMLTLLTAYLKYYYPIEFLTSAIGRMKSSNKADRMKLLRYMMEAKRLGIRILLPHVNASNVGIEIQTDDKGDHIRLGLSNIKGIGEKTGIPLMDGRPWKSYEELEAASKVKNSGIRLNMLKALNAVGAAAFEDNPRTGNERENYFTYLSLPALDAREIDPVVYANFDSLLNHEDDKVSVFMGIVASDTRKNNWRRIEIADEQATASVFIDPNSPIEVGDVYVFMISGNNLIRYIKVHELKDDKKFYEFLKASSFPDIPDEMVRVVAFSSRTTKAGKRMATMIVADNEKDLIPVLVFPQQFMQAFAKCREGEVVDIDLKLTNDGAVFLDKILD